MRRRTRSALAAGLLLGACGDAVPPAPAPAPPPVRAPAAPQDPAVAVFERRVAEVPSDGPSRAILAHLYLRRWELRGDPGDPRRAEAAAAEAIRLDPENAQAVAHRARALTALHRYDEAVAACDAWLDARGANVFVLEAKADAALESGRLALARDVADALLARSGDAPAILVQARLAELGGDPARAATLARDAAAAAADGGMLPHEIARCHVVAGETALRTGRPGEARTDFERALRACPEHAGALGGLSDAAAAEGRASEALGFAERAASQRPAPREWFRVAALRPAGPGADDAAARATQACEAAPQIHGRELADHLAASRRDLGRALALADADVALRPDPEGHAVRARVLLAMGRADEAQAEIALARRHGTRTPSILCTAARVALRRGDEAAARSAVAELRGIAPSLVPADLAGAGEPGR